MDEMSMQPQQTPMQPEQPEMQMMQPPKDKKPKWWVWAIIILSVIIVGGLVVYFVLG